MKMFNPKCIVGPPMVGVLLEHFRFGDKLEPNERLKVQREVADAGLKPSTDDNHLYYQWLRV